MLVAAYSGGDLDVNQLAKVLSTSGHFAAVVRRNNAAQTAFQNRGKGDLQVGDISTTILDTSIRRFGNDGSCEPVACGFPGPCGRTGLLSPGGGKGESISSAGVSKLPDPGSPALRLIPDPSLLPVLLVRQHSSACGGASHWWRENTFVFWNWSSCDVICLCWSLLSFACCCWVGMRKKMTLQSMSCL